jgi:DNA helicase-2/ATP-dependent DNA helicase PcrA
LKKDFLKDLNDAQQLAVKHTEGPVMVVAGAGSGKTRVLTYRVAWLIASGVDPFNILALTFTNKAAREMKERITSLVDGSSAKAVWMGTFHSVFARILRSEAHRLGYPSNYTIYDTDDSKSLLRTIIKEKGLDKQLYPAGFVLSRISAAKTSMISPQEYNISAEILAQDQASGKPKLGELYSTYASRCKQAGAMDFDDLLYNTHILFERFPEVLYRFQQQFTHILVDEYQDTNHVQYLIVKSLAANNENLCVVGDDAQSIYAFRGANIQNILNFRRDYPDHALYKLEQNYRSTGTIVKAANGVIERNKDQIRKTIWTDNEAGSLIRLRKAASDNEEGMIVANSIFELRMNLHEPARSFVVLYRTNAQSRAIEEALRKLNIPYRIFGGLSFYSRKEIKDILAYFRLIINPGDEEALKRIINYPARGIGDTTMNKVIAAAGDRQLSLWQVMDMLDEDHLGINAGTRSRIREFMDLIRRFRAELRKTDAFLVARQIVNASGIMKELENDDSFEGEARFENIEELLNAIKDFTDQEREGAEVLGLDGEELPSFRILEEFMLDVALITDADTEDKENKDYVSLMTIHAAKGLEFPHVFVVGLEENLFPNIMSIGTRAELEEERRLFYVAITRAMKSLHLSYAETRYRWGSLTFCEPSRFIDDVDEQFIEMPQKAPVPPLSGSSTGTGLPARLNLNKKNYRKLSAIGSPAPQAASDDNIVPGIAVEHEAFGQGKVLSVEGVGANRKATVFFPGVGQKQLLLRFAKLRILD